jgi:hypothetical protein
LTYARCFEIVPQINKAISGLSTAQRPYPEPKSSINRPGIVIIIF